MWGAWLSAVAQKLGENKGCVVLGVFRHADSKSSLYFLLSMFLKEVLVISCWNPCQLFQNTETRHVFSSKLKMKIWDRNMILRLLFVNDGTFHPWHNLSHNSLFFIAYRIAHSLSHFSPGPDTYNITPVTFISQFQVQCSICVMKEGKI